MNRIGQKWVSTTNPEDYFLVTAEDIQAYARRWKINFFDKGVFSHNTDLDEHWFTVQTEYVLSQSKNSPHSW